MAVGRKIVFGILGAVFAATAQADCADDIAALYDGGAMDSFARPPHHMVSTMYAPDGALKSVTDMVSQGPTRLISGIRDSGQVMMMIGVETWMGPGFDGPWQYMGQMQVADAEAAQRAVVTDEKANITDPECLGVVSLNGAPHDVYRFSTRTLPHEDRGNSWFGGQKTAFVDQATGLLTRVEITNHIASWHPDVVLDNQVSDFTYDPTIEITRPDG